MRWLVTTAVICGILLLVAAIAMLRIRVTVTADPALSVQIKILCFTISLVPGKEKKIRLRDFQINRFRRLRKKQKEKERRKSEKKRKKEKKKDAGRKEPSSEKKFSLSDLPSLLSLVKRLVGCAGRHLKKDIRIRLSLLDIRVASEEASQTALLYGTVSQGVAYLLTLLSENMHLIIPSDAYIAVFPDYLAAKTEVRFRCAVWLRIHHIFSLLFGLIFTYLKK